jgi:hypothetical protein
VICETKCIWSHYLPLDREKSLPDLALSLRTRATLQPIDATTPWRGFANRLPCPVGLVGSPHNSTRQLTGFFNRLLVGTAHQTGTDKAQGVRGRLALLPLSWPSEACESWRAELAPAGQRTIYHGQRAPFFPPFSPVSEAHLSRANSSTSGMARTKWNRIFSRTWAGTSARSFSFI